MFFMISFSTVKLREKTVFQLLTLRKIHGKNW
jgi:hypothetical protein